MQKNIKKIALKIQKKAEKQLLKKPVKLIFWSIFPLISYFIASYFSAVIINVSLALIFWNNGTGYQNAISNTITTTVYSVLFFSLMLAIIYLVPVKIFKQKISKDDIALKGLITWKDLGFAIFGFIISMIFAGILLEILPNILNFDKSQVQDLTFERGGMLYSWQFLLAFISVVVIAPVFEELIFRGIIYSQLRKVNVWLAIFITSLLFGIVHLQMNVGVTVFAMSIVMCLIREKFTKTIWSGIVVHMLKNGIAFVILYVFPVIQTFQG